MIGSDIVDDKLKVKIETSDKQILIESKKGQNLLEILRENHIDIEAPCNGNGTCSKCRVYVRTNEDRNKSVLACQTRVEEDMELILNCDSSKVLYRGLGSSNNKVLSDNLSIALDIGTTGIEMVLVDSKSGEEILKISETNPQKNYGLDVLSRISYCKENPKGLKNLNRLIVSKINEMVGAFGEDICSRISLIVVAANCTMSHILMCESVDGLGRYPFTPEFKDTVLTKATSLGIDNLKNADLVLMPQVSAYVGGDIVSGLYSIGYIDVRKRYLFIDIGTNGEIALIDKGNIVTCSCAAGPALEGMNISNGMRAEDGAIEDVVVDKKNKSDSNIEIKSIGSQEIRGICGSGILALVRELVRNGYVNKRGKLAKKEELEEDDPLIDHFESVGSEKRFYLDKDKDIYINQADIRAVQLAKGAIYSSLMMILKRQGLGVEDIDQLLIAGQFGYHLPKESLVGLGIIDKEYEDKITYLGNSSKNGALKFIRVYYDKNKDTGKASTKYRKNILDKASSDKLIDMIDELDRLASSIDYFELANEERFDRAFAKAMTF